MARRCSFFLATLVALLGVAPTAFAQAPGRFALGMGPQADPNSLGHHIFAAAAFPTFSSAVRVRVDALAINDGGWEPASATANLLYDPLVHPLAPYAIAGAGVFLEDGVPRTANLGLGWNLPARLNFGGDRLATRVLPLFAELRGHLASEFTATFSIGAQF
jgi:hypothetical protein